MEKLLSYISFIEETLLKNAELKSPKALYDPIKYTIELGGKRIRPALLLLANDLFGGEKGKAINPALAIEIFHNFTLLHDDIMDNAPLRRGKDSVFKKWGTNGAILSGDVMFVQSVKLLSKCDPKVLPEVLDIFTQTAIEVCEGQQYDMDFEKVEDIYIEDYLKMIELKTAVLLAGSLKIGAICGGADSENANHIYEFGKNLGIAFQLMDDILDLYGNPEKVGKRIGGDIISNKKTYLLLKAKELAEGKTKNELEFCLSSKALSEDKKVERVKSIFDSLGIKELAKAEMNLFYNSALSHLDSINAPKKKKLVFEQFASNLMQRES